MTIQNMDQLLQRAARLNPLGASLAGQPVDSECAQRNAVTSIAPEVERCAGLLPYPALGEDAQSYISRSRRADDDRRAQIIRDGE